jgi:hypothetical protein
MRIDGWHGAGTWPRLPRRTSDLRYDRGKKQRSTEQRRPLLLQPRKLRPGEQADPGYGANHDYDAREPPARRFTGDCHRSSS